MQKIILDHLFYFSTNRLNFVHSKSLPSPSTNPPYPLPNTECYHRTKLKRKKSSPSPNCPWLRCKLRPLHPPPVQACNTTKNSKSPSPPEGMHLFRPPPMVLPGRKHCHIQTDLFQSQLARSVPVLEFQAMSLTSFSWTSSWAVHSYPHTVFH